MKDLNNEKTFNNEKIRIKYANFRQNEKYHHAEIVPNSYNPKNKTISVYKRSINELTKPSFDRYYKWKHKNNLISNIAVKRNLIKKLEEKKKENIEKIDEFNDKIKKYIKDIIIYKENNILTFWYRIVKLH